MNLDDESLLSAYLDDELDPGRRSLVEAALQSSPYLARRLREIKGVRDALGGLAIPRVGFDLAPAVLDRLQAARETRQRRSATRWRGLRRALVVGPTIGLAATLLLCWSFGLFHFGPRKPAHTRGPSPHVASHPADSETAVSPVKPDQPSEPFAVASTGTPKSEAIAESKAATPPSNSDVALSNDVDIEKERQTLKSQDELRELLDRPDVRRFLLVVDALNAEPTQKVDQAIGQTDRANPRYARFRVCQGLAIDPRHPGEAIVYAVILDDTELNNFKRNLSKQFPNAPLDTDPVSAPMVSQLTETDGIDLFEGQAVGTILADAPAGTPRSLARREEIPQPLGRAVDVGGPGFSGFDSTSVGGSSTHRVPIARNDRPRSTAGSAVSTQAGQPEAPPVVEPSESRPAVYLVWVTTATPALNRRE